MCLSTFHIIKRIFIISVPQGVIVYLKEEGLSISVNGVVLRILGSPLHTIITNIIFVIDNADLIGE
jgi:hypothetical protein